MCVVLSFCLFFVEIMKERWVQSGQVCAGRAAVAREGVLGCVGTFPWLGVIRVHLHEDTGLKVALTGVVLVKENYAIGNADDIGRIPTRILREDSQAMFIPADNTPWFCRLVDYMTHPEYQLDTTNTIAIVQLDPGQDNTFPMKPACWPPTGYNVSTHIYALGYTDENEVLEKFVHKLQYVEPQLCKEYYNRGALQEGKMAPLHFTCGFAVNNKEHCVWDNGMALVGNATGTWLLLGLGLHGPGCAAPARFLSLQHYYSWIESSTNVQEMSWKNSFRKTGFREGLQPKNVVKYIPVHELLQSHNRAALRGGSTEGVHKKHELSHYHPYDVLTQEDDPFHINRINGTIIDIVKTTPGFMRGSVGDCSATALRQIYRDDTLVKFLPDAATRLGTLLYKLSLYDVYYSNYTCIRIKLQSTNAGQAYLDYKTQLTDDTLFPQNPIEIMQYYPLYKLSRLIEKSDVEHLKPDPIQSAGRNLTVDHVNLYLTANFKGICKMEISFYGPYVGSTTEPPTTKLRTTRRRGTTRTTADPYTLTEKPSILRENPTIENRASGESWTLGLIGFVVLWRFFY